MAEEIKIPELNNTLGQPLRKKPLLAPSPLNLAPEDKHTEPEDNVVIGEQPVAPISSESPTQEIAEPVVNTETEITTQQPENDMAPLQPTTDNEAEVSTQQPAITPENENTDSLTNQPTEAPTNTDQNNSVPMSSETPQEVPVENTGLTDVVTPIPGSETEKSAELPAETPVVSPLPEALTVAEDTVKTIDTDNSNETSPQTTNLHEIPVTENPVLPVESNVENTPNTDEGVEIFDQAAPVAQENVSAETPKESVAEIIDKRENTNSNPFNTVEVTGALPSTEAEPAEEESGVTNLTSGDLENDTPDESGLRSTVQEDNASTQLSGANMMSQGESNTLKNENNTLPPLPPLPSESMPESADRNMPTISSMQQQPQKPMDISQSADLNSPFAFDNNQVEGTNNMPDEHTITSRNVSIGTPVQVKGSDKNDEKNPVLDNFQKEDKFTDYSLVILAVILTLIVLVLLLVPSVREGLISFVSDVIA